MLRNLTYFFILGFLLNACVFSNCETIDLTKEEKSYFDTFQTNKTLKFKNKILNSTIIFNIDFKIMEYSTCSKIEIGPFVNQYFNIQYESNISDSNWLTQFSIYFEKEKKQKKCFKEFRCLDFYTNFYDETDKLKWIEFKNKPLQVLFLDKHKFKEQPNNYVKAIYWSKKYGLVRFDTFDGQYFELQ